MSVLTESALKALAAQLISSRWRLANRMEGKKPPWVGEMAVALNFYVEHRDNARAEATPSATKRLRDEVFESLKDKKRLRQLIDFSSLAYGTRKELDEAACTEPKFRIVCSRHVSDLYEPAYFLAHFPDTRELALVVRGTYDVADVLTDASLETDEFLGSFGHRGIVRSARWLFRKLLPTLRATVDAGGVDRVVLTGHSLGASVAAAITLMLRCDTQGIGEKSEILSNATCVALCPPPFLSEELAESTSDMGITSVVNGLDCISRMTAASLDRFFLEVAQFDWSSMFCDATERATGAWIKAEDLANLEKAVNKVFGPSTSVELTKSSDTSMQQQEQADFALARNLGITVQEEDPPDMYIAGRIVHLDIPFVHPHRLTEGTPIQRPSFKLASRNAFRDIDPSEHMTTHHMLGVLREQLDLMLEAQEDNP